MVLKIVFFPAPRDIFTIGPNVVIYRDSRTLNQESVVEKVKKLLALADGNQNEHEREVAMQFAMDLLAKHNLTMSEIEGAVTQLSTIEVDGDFRLEPWIRLVLQAACKLYYSEFYICERIDYFRYCKVKIPVFIGTAENIAVTMDVAAWLIDSIRRESNWAYRDAAERRSFRLGAADRIFERAFAMVEAENRQAGKGTGTSLPVIRNQLEQANQAHLAGLNLRMMKPRRTYVTSEAYADGEAYGNQVGLKGHSESKKVKGLLPDFAASFR